VGSRHRPSPSLTGVSADPRTTGSEDLERVFLGEPVHLSARMIEEATGAEREIIDALWRALGFVESEDDLVAYTDLDLQALRTSLGLLQGSVLDLPVLLTLTRGLGQAMSHLASSQVETVVEAMAADPAVVAAAAQDPEALVRAGLATVQTVGAPVEQLLTYVWRRHLLAATQRVVGTVLGSPEHAAVGVGFADLVGYTALTRDATADELRQLVDSFETRAFDHVIAAGARVVKTLGDEVMWVADDPGTTARVGLALAEEFGAEGDRVPPVRVGVAWGPAVQRAGDVFGAVVNIASRLTGVARPGTVLADRELSDALAADPWLSLHRVSPVKVRGYSALVPHVVRRGSGG